MPKQAVKVKGDEPVAETVRKSIAERGRTPTVLLGTPDTPMCTR
jgi:hypothetical protein